MPDAADLAADLEAARIEVGLARIGAAIPNGVAGECHECGAVMPRLVGGRCGFCRDGRRPPLSRFDDPAPPPAPLSPPKETTAMPTLTPTADSQTIAMPCRGEVLAAVKARAERDGEPLGRSAAAIIADALAQPAAPDPVAAGLEAASVEDLLSFLQVRLTSGVSQQDYNQAIARAEAAEASLALIGGVLSGHVVPAGAGL